MNTTIQNLQDRFSSIGYRAEIESYGTYATGAIYKPTPKARLRNEKMISGYRFKTTEDAIAYIQKELTQFEKNIEASKIIKERARVQKEQQAASVDVGDVFHCSWGFEQTQCEFYQVVAKPSPKTVIIRQIAGAHVRTHGWASEELRPVVDSFVGEEEKIRLSGDWIRFSSYRMASKVSKQELESGKGFYHSWYA